MASQKKFGAFAGVFTPSLLTILGVIMYMRLGWVVGNAGLVGALLIIVIAHVISVSTGLSISSIATDKKVGAGGVYYVLSRSLGLPIGGAIGVTLFTGTALSIALYLIGFAESFNAYLGLNTGINGLRIGGSLALLTLTVLALISTSLALKAQFFIMAAIGISLLSIVLGASPELPKSLPFLATDGSASMESVFAIFFPAVTGFTAGIAMSGDLKDPKKAIPVGTLWAIGVGFLVYVGLAVFVFYSVDSSVLKTDNTIFMKLALFAPAVVAGIWGATLSSALGGILGGPRILQAMSVDKITPRRFGKGVGKDNEPRNALFLTVLIAQVGILIGELDTIARVCTMFYLAAYGFINLSFFLESWSSTDFNPTFRVKKWVGLAGFVATFAVMFRLDMVAMIVAFIVIGGIYFWLAKRELALGSGDVWQSVWSSVVKTGLRRMDDKQDHKRNWKPNVLLFSGGTDQRHHLLEFGKELVGNRGIVTNFDLRENEEAKVLFPKHQQSVSDEVLKKYGIFGRQIEVQNVFKGIETIAATFGFSGVEPNTILMGWGKNTKDPIWFAQMTQKLIDLDYNVLYLDYDYRFGFRQYARIDLWWRGLGDNAELMLNIARFLLASELWRNAQVRVILVDNTHSNKVLIEKKIVKVLEESRVPASVKVIGNALEQRPIYELMKIYSSETDLVLVGIPDVKVEDVKTFVKETNDLVGTIGTTLLVKASSHFDQLEIIARDPAAQPPQQGVDGFPPLPASVPATFEALQSKTGPLEAQLHAATTRWVENALAPIQEKYLGFYHLILAELQRVQSPEETDIYQAFSTLLEHLGSKLERIRTTELPAINELFTEENHRYWDTVTELLDALPQQIPVPPGAGRPAIRLKRTAHLLKDQSLVPAVRSMLIRFGNACYTHLFKTQNELIAKIYSLFEVEGFYQNYRELDAEIRAVIAELSQTAKVQMTYFQQLTGQFEFEMQVASRNFCNELVTVCQDPDPAKKRAELKRQRNKKLHKSHDADVRFFSATWSKNQMVIHTSIETNLRLARVNLLIERGLGSLSQTAEQEIDRRMEKLFATHGAAIQKLIRQQQAEEEIQVRNLFNTEEQAFPGMELLMQKLKDSTQGTSAIIREDAVLMNKALMEDFEAQQWEDRTPITLDVSKIIDFILESKLNGLVQNHVERYLADVSNIFFNQLNSISLLNYSLSESRNKSEIHQLLNRVAEKTEKEKELYETTRLRFRQRIRAIAYDLKMELNTQYLVDHADNWSRYISVSKRKKGIANLVEQAQTRLTDGYQAVNRMVAARQHESARSVFESKYDVKSNIEQGLDYVHAMGPPQPVLAELPFYYKQLFQGKHLPVQHTYIGRSRQLERWDTVLKEERKGAVLVVGKSGSGKSHFSAFIAGKKGQGRVFEIDGDGKQGTVKELHRAVAAATGKAGEIEPCLAELPRHSVLLFNDLEVWWDRTQEHDALSVLLKMVEKFQQKHTFIFNANLHAYEALSKQRPVGQAVTTTLLMTPLSKESMQEIILERHKVGGLDLVLQDEENRLEGSAFSRLMHRIHVESEGNPGLGLQLWLRQIRAFSGNKIYLEEQPPLEPLKVREACWKWILYQLLINKNLTRSKLTALFGSDAPEISAFLAELLRAGIVEEVRKNTFTLSKTAKPHVENWLTYHHLIS